MPQGSSVHIAPDNTQIQFQYYLEKCMAGGNSGSGSSVAPEGHELLYHQDSDGGPNPSLHFQARPPSWISRQIARLRTRIEVAKLIDAQFGACDTIVTKRWFLPNETLGDRLMKDCATPSGVSFNKIDSAALTLIAKRLAAIHSNLGIVPEKNDTSNPFRISVNISREDLRALYKKADTSSLSHVDTQAAVPSHQAILDEDRPQGLIPVAIDNAVMSTNTVGTQTDSVKEISFSPNHSSLQEHAVPSMVFNRESMEFAANKEETGNSKDKPSIERRYQDASSVVRDDLAVISKKDFSESSWERAEEFSPASPTMADAPSSSSKKPDQKQSNNDVSDRKYNGVKTEAPRTENLNSIYRDMDPKLRTRIEDALARRCTNTPAQKVLDDPERKSKYVRNASLWFETAKPFIDAYYDVYLDEKLEEIREQRALVAERLNELRSYREKDPEIWNFLARSPVQKVPRWSKPQSYWDALEMLDSQLDTDIEETQKMVQKFREADKWNRSILDHLGFSGERTKLLTHLSRVRKNSEAIRDILSADTKAREDRMAGVSYTDADIINPEWRDKLESIAQLNDEICSYASNLTKGTCMKLVEVLEDVGAVMSHQIQRAHLIEKKLGPMGKGFPYASWQDPNFSFGSYWSD